MKRSFKLVSMVFAMTGVLFLYACSKDELEEIDFNFDRILGVYSNTRISGLPNSINLRDIAISISRQDVDTFFVTFDTQEYDSLPKIKFTLTPSSVDQNGQYWTMIWADIKLKLEHEFVQFSPSKFSVHDDWNYFEYADTYESNFERFQMSIQSIDSIGTNSWISIEGERVY